MIASETEYKRSRPLLGTYFTIKITKPLAAAEAIANQGFNETERLEKIFSIHSADSALSRFNQEKTGAAISAPRELYDLLKLSQEIGQASEGAFNPNFPEPMEASLTFLEDGYIIKNSRARFDLSGIAKGYIVDRVSDLLVQHGTPAVVNAGGDLRFLNQETRSVILRLGPYDKPVMQTLNLCADAVASSSPSIANQDSASSSRYSLRFRAGFTSEHTATVLANSCAVADALCKVALFASSDIIENCAEQFTAQVLVFDPVGKLQEVFGEV